MLEGAYDSDVDASSLCVMGLTIALLSGSANAGRAEIALCLIDDLHLMFIYLS